MADAGLSALVDPAAVERGALAAYLQSVGTAEPVELAREEGVAADVVTQMQEQLDLIAKHAFNFVGSLARDAPPVAADGASAAALPGAGAAAPAYTPAELASQVVRASARFDRLASSLPAGGGAAAVHASGATDADLARLAAENDAIGRELAAGLELAEARLAGIRRAFIAVAPLAMPPRHRDDHREGR